MSGVLVRRRSWAVLTALAVGALAAASSMAGSVGQFGGCAVRGPLPDPGCTPGAIFSGAGVVQICRSGYARSVRNVPYSLKRRVYYSYGIRRHRRGRYEVDHLVPLELGGSNAQSNLWPEPAPGFHEKDALENQLHDQVCSARIGLRAAQMSIARNWYADWVHAGRP